MPNLIHGDCIEELAKLPENSIDAIVTDPPYGLGFMGKKWDDLPPGREFAEQALRVLKPGGHLLAFGGTRTYHRLACAIEDAGFEIRDCLAWLYGSGFPKSHNLKDEWEGWGTALKPAHEPIVLARKPLTGTVAGNVLEFRTGALNVDGCRVDGAPDLRGRDAPGNLPNGNGQTHGAMERTPYEVPAGRWPANVILDREAGAMLDEQSGERPTGAVKPYTERHENATSYAFQRDKTFVKDADTGGASRFFYCAKASKRERNEGLEGFEEPVTATPKANVHPTVKPIALMRWLVRLVTPPNGTVLDPFLGSGTTGIAAKLEGFDFIGIERESEYLAIARARIDHHEPEPEPAQLELAA